MSRKTYLILCIILISLFLEMSLRFLLGPPNKKIIANLLQSKPYNIYTERELDRNIKFRHEFHGGNCVKLGLADQKLNWILDLGIKIKK